MCGCQAIAQSALPPLASYRLTPLALSHPGVAVCTLGAGSGAYLVPDGSAFRLLAAREWRAAAAYASTDLHSNWQLGRAPRQRLVKAHALRLHAAALAPQYIADYKWDVRKLEPLVAAPHSPDNRKTARECSDVKIDRVYIGSCTGERR